MSTKKTNTPSNESESVKELKSLIAEAEKALASAGDEASEEVDNISQRVRQSLEHGRDRVVEVAKDQAANADEFVHDKPYIAIGIAAGLGLIAGALVSRRCNC